MSPVIAVLIALVTSIISILGTIAATQRRTGQAEGRDAERVQGLTLHVGAHDHRLDKLEYDMRELGNKIRTVETVVQIAGNTGEVPRYPRTSGEGSAVR